MLAAGVSPLQAQSVACMVNGEPITNLDIEQRTKLNFLTTRKQMPRQEVIEELTNEKVKIKEAKKFGVDPSASDIDQAYAGMSSRMRLSADQLTKSLESQGVRPETLKARLKADMVWTSLVRGRYKESLQVGEKDVAAAAQESGDAGQAEAFEYKMQPIVLIVPRGSASTSVDARRKEAESLRERVQTCEQANSYFKSMPNAAIREARRQDFGRHPGPASRIAGQDADRSPDPARDHQAGRGDGCPLREEADQDRYAEEAGNPGKDVRPEIRGEVESLPDRHPKSRHDRMSLMAARPKPLALTSGEPAGIGPDIAIAAWLRRKELESSAVLSARRSRVLHRACRKSWD